MTPSSPNDIDDAPPGGACVRVVRRSVSTLLQFWSNPFANALLDVIVVVVVVVVDSRRRSSRAVRCDARLSFARVGVDVVGAPRVGV